MDSQKKYLTTAPSNAEVLFGSYPLYNERMEIMGNKGQIIAKTERLNMRFVNAVVLIKKSILECKKMPQKYIL